MKLVNIATTILVITVFSCNNEVADKQAAMESKNDSTKIKIEELVAEGWNKKNAAYLNDKLTDNFVRTVNGITVVANKNEMGPAMNIFFKGFPDLDLVINNITAKGNIAYTNWTFSGTNTGVFGEAPATGKKVTIGGISVSTWDDSGKLSREDVYYNELAMMQQLGYTLQAPVAK